MFNQHVFGHGLGLVLIYAGLNTSFVVWMMQSFLEEIPRDIEEAAMVDGDSRLTALWRVVVPLAAPGLIATAIFTVIATYNDFIIALTLTSTPAAQTIPVGVSTLIGKIEIQWGRWRQPAWSEHCPSSSLP